MDCLPDHLVLTLRAELTLCLLRLGRLDEAVEGALPLVGTEYQAWFLHARAWQEWARGREDEAREILRAAHRVVGKDPDGPVDFLLVGGRPLLAQEFSRNAVPGPLAPRLIPETKTLSPEAIRSPQDAARIFALLRPMLPLCATGYQASERTLSRREEDPWQTLVLRSLLDLPTLRGLAERLCLLSVDYPFRVSVAAGAAFYLILQERYSEALKICRTLLLRRPATSVVRALSLVCLYRLGRRGEVVSEGERLLTDPRGDRDGLGLLFLGIFASEEGAFEVALRFFRESAVRGNEFAQGLEQAVGELFLEGGG